MSHVVMKLSLLSADPK